MAVILKNLLRTPSSRLTTIRCFKSIGSGNHASGEYRIGEIDYAGNHISIAKRFIIGVYSFTYFVFPFLSPTKKVEKLLNIMDIARPEVKKSDDVVPMAPHADEKVNPHMEEKAPKKLGYNMTTNDILGKVRIWQVLDDPSGLDSLPNLKGLESLPNELKEMGFNSNQIVSVIIHVGNPTQLQIWKGLDGSLKREFVKAILEEKK